MRSQLDFDDKIKSHSIIIHQILDCLIRNAITHAFEEKRGAIVIYTKRKHNNLLLSFEDNGKGVEVKDLDLLFQPFYTTSYNSGSPGLGLYIVFNLVTIKLGGEVKVYPVKDGGLGFQLTLPGVIEPMS